MLKKIRIGAAAVLIAATLAMGAGPVAASTAKNVALSQSPAWALLILQREARAHAAMSRAGVGPSLAGNK